MTFETDKDLSPITTFHLPAHASLFVEYASPKELQKIMADPRFFGNRILHIGGGSNLLFVKDFDGLVIRSAIKGIVRYDKNESTAFAIAGAGESWRDFVDWCVASGLAGVENLAGIPGQVGAAAVQNIGAYGAEAADVIHHVECLDLLNREVKVFTAEECQFAYRDSMFKHEGKGRYIVLRVSFRLKVSTKAENLVYGPLRQLEERLGHSPSIHEVASEVVKIRDSKLPDPERLGSAGSFFKNPVVDRSYYESRLLSEHPEMPHYDHGKDKVKVPAGWLIEHAGLKGYRIGGAQVYERQCLVIVNTGNATAEDVVNLADHVMNTVKEKYGIELFPEVNYIE